MKPATKRNYELWTYDEVWNKIKKKLKLTDEELRKQVELALQMWAWADITDDIEQQLEFERNPPPDFKAIIEKRKVGK